MIKLKILITGATSGIGYEVGLALMRKGHFVYLTTHTKEEAKKLSQKVKKETGSIICFSLDVNKESDRKKLERLDIDVLICNAAIGQGGSMIDVPLKEVKKVFETNLFSNIALMQEFLKSNSKESPKKIIVSSSLAGYIPIPYLSSYVSSKAALSLTMKTLRKELQEAHYYATVSIIEPGIYETGFNEKMIESQEKYPGRLSSKEIEERILSQKKWFQIFGRKNLQSITKQYVKAVESPYAKKVYRAPFLSRLGIKLYFIFFG